MPFADGGGTVCKSVTLEGLTPGTYTVTEERVIRYRIESIDVSQNGVVDGDSAVFVFGRTDNEGTATFTNVVINQEGTSDTVLCRNEFDFTGKSGADE